MEAAPFIGFERHRISTDGEGVTTLVAFHGCPLRCRYCLNPQCLVAKGVRHRLTPAEVVERAMVDNLYFMASGGGLTFGGGEPALHSRFIAEVRQICPPEWHLNIETSLNVPQHHIELLAECIDWFLIDIKDMNPSIYHSYTGCDNSQVIDNLHWLAGNGKTGNVRVRVPHIPGYNSSPDWQRSRDALSAMGFATVEEFDYITHRPGKEDLQASP